MEGPERRLRVLAESDSRRPALPSSSLDPRSDALVRIAALVAVHAAPPSYVCAVRHALTVGVTVDEVIDTLIAVSATVGLARVVSASPGMANALGIDIDSALEELQIDTSRAQRASRSCESDSRASASPTSGKSDHRLSTYSYTRARLAAVAAMFVLTTTGIAACGGDDDDSASSSPSLCDDSQALQSSVQDLKDVNVVENGTSSLQSAVTKVKDDADTLVTAAKDEFKPEVDDLTSALSTLATSIGNIVSDGVQPVKDATLGRRGRGDGAHRQGRCREVRLTS